MINLTKEQIQKSLPKIKKGLVQYLWIQEEFSKRDVSMDEEFQRKYNYFYKITPHRDKVWQKEFYSLLQRSKDTDISFDSILSTIYMKTGRIEASFVSKLKATVNPDIPVIDSVVLKNLGIKKPYVHESDRQVKYSKIYRELVAEFSRYLSTENGTWLISEFVREYPDANITKVKMLDLVLWQTRTK